MTTLYGSILLVGCVALIGWIAAAAIAGSVEGWGRVDPEDRFGARGRCVVAGCLGFGMAGISMLYTSFPDWMSVFAAVIGALALVVVVARVVPPTGE